MTQAPTPGPLSAQQEEAIAFNLCSLHGFDPAFVTTQRDFAFAVIREYERARPSLAPPAPVEASGSVVKRVMDRNGLEHATTPGHPDAFLNALLDYTAGFYSAAREAGMPASKVADAMHHVESAARGLHFLALRPQPSGETREAVARVSHRQAAHHAEVGTDPMTAMLRDIDERLNRDSPDIPGARVAIHGARLAAAYSALETGK